MKPLFATLALALLSTLPSLAAAPRNDIDAALGQVRKLDAMKPGAKYTLTVNGEKVTDRKDSFLRRRNAAEIAQSGLSCGCGDYAILFIDLMQARGYETIMVDSAQISLQSLGSEFSGHSVVAVRPKSDPKARWWLVDSTSRRVLSEDWSTDASSFVSGSSLYWIGYVGPLEKYPAHTPQELRKFYRDTLATVPPAVFNRTIPRLTFTVDDSLKLGADKYRNPNIPRLTSEQERLFAKYKITPERQHAVRLVRGGDDGRGELKSVEGEWIATVGLQSACSPSFLNYMATAIASQQQENALQRDNKATPRPTSLKL